MTTLKRELKFWDSVAITVGIVIGVGIFRTPGAVAKHLDHPTLILLAWLVGGAISFLGVLCYAELSSRFPETGGTYVYLREAYGKFTGFLYGWAEFSINRAATIAAVAYIFAAYLGTLLPVGAGNEKWTAFLLISALTLVNMAGLHFGIRLQHVLSALKVLAILGVAGLIFGFTKSTSAVSWPALSTIHFQSLSHFAPALIPVLWTYGGWHESTFLSGEFRDTKRELPRALIASACIVTALYVLLNAAYLYLFQPSELAGSNAIASDALMKLLGHSGAFIVTLIVLTSSLGALNSNVITGGRVPFSVARDCPRLNWLGAVDAKRKTPLRSLAVNGAWASILVLWGNFEQLLFLNAFEIWLFFILAGISVFILRTKSGRRDSHYAMIGYPAVPILFTLVSIWLCWATVQSAPQEALTGALIILAGIPVYFLVGGKTTK